MKKLILILGMHRSGTSAIAYIFQKMGAYLGEEEELLAADQYNADGYYENKGVVVVHDWLLYHYGQTWSSCGQFEIDFQDSDVAALKKRLTALMEKTFIKSDIVCVKDPRTALLLPFWEKVIGELGVQAKYVWIYRNPEEVAASLMKRDRLPMEQGILLWEYYNLQIMEFLESRPYVMVSYDQLFETGKMFQKVREAIDIPIGREQADALKGMVKSNLRHIKSPDPSLSGRYGELCMAMWKAMEQRNTEEKAVRERKAKHEFKTIHELRTMYLEERNKYPIPPYSDYEAIADSQFFSQKKVVIYGTEDAQKEAARLLCTIGREDFLFCSGKAVAPEKGIEGVKTVSMEALAGLDGPVVVVMAVKDRRFRKIAEENFRYVKGIQFVSFLTLVFLSSYSLKNCP